MFRASKPISCGFCLIVAVTLAPTFPAMAQEIIILAPETNAASLSHDTPAVRNAGTVMGAVLAEAGFRVFQNSNGASSGLKIHYAVHAEIRRGIFLKRASLRIETKIYSFPRPRLLGRIEKKSNAPFRISETCVGSCIETRLGSDSVEVARRVGRALNLRLPELSRLSRRAARSLRDW